MLNSKVLLLLAISTLSVAADYSTYPQVPKSASINGFADPIYSSIPECAKACVAQDTDSTPCPYWDAGCLCVMSNWSGAVAQCVAEACQGDAVESFTQIALSECSTVGAPSPYWFIPDSASTALANAVTAEATTTAESSQDIIAPSTSNSPSTTADQTSSTVHSTITSMSTSGASSSVVGSSTVVSSSPDSSSSVIGSSAGTSSVISSVPSVSAQVNGANVIGSVTLGAAVAALIAVF